MFKTEDSQGNSDVMQNFAEIKNQTQNMQKSTQNPPIHFNICGCPGLVGVIMQTETTLTATEANFIPLSGGLRT